MRAVWIVSSSLYRTVGHEHGYTGAVAEALRRLGRDVRVLGRTDADRDVRSMAGFVPVFEPPPDAHALNYAQRARSFARDLVSGLARSGWDPSAPIFDHTIVHSNLAGWCLAFRNLSPRTEAHLILRFSTNLPVRRPLKRSLLRASYRLLLSRFHGRRVSLWTDTEGLRAEFQSLTDRPVGVVPIPLEPSEFGVESARHRNGLRLAHPGGYRAGRGSEHLDRLARHVAARKGKVIVSGIRPPEDEPTLLEFPARDRSRAAYLEFLRSADAVLLPYAAGEYGAQSSNAQAEAFALGKPVLVPAGTWMESQLEGRGVAFAGSEDLERATSDLLDGLPRFTEAARAARERWLGYHNADVLVRILGM